MKCSGLPRRATKRISILRSIKARRNIKSTTSLEGTLLLILKDPTKGDTTGVVENHQKNLLNLRVDHSDQKSSKKKKK